MNENRNRAPMYISRGSSFYTFLICAVVRMFVRFAIETSWKNGSAEEEEVTKMKSGVQWRAEGQLLQSRA